MNSKYAPCLNPTKAKRLPKSMVVNNPKGRPRSKIKIEHQVEINEQCSEKSTMKKYFLTFVSATEQNKCTVHLMI